MKITLEDGTVIEVDDKAAELIQKQTREKVTKEAETWDNALKANAKKTFDNLDIRLQQIIKDDLKIDVGNIVPTQLSDAINSATKILEKKLQTSSNTNNNQNQNTNQSQSNNQNQNQNNNQQNNQNQNNQSAVDFQAQLDEARRQSSQEFEKFKKEQLEKEKSTKIGAFKQLIIAEAIKENLRDNAKGAFESSLDRYYNFDYNEQNGQIIIRDKNNSVVLVEGRDALPKDIPTLIKKQEGYMFQERTKGSGNGGPGDETSGSAQTNGKRDLSKVSPNQLIQDGIAKEINFDDNSVSF